MTRKATVLLISFLLLSTLLFQSLTLARVTADGQETEYYVKSLITYSNKGNTVWNFTERVGDRSVGLFMTNSWQTASIVNSTYPIETENDTDGNEIAVLQFPEMLLNPGQNISYAVTYRVVSKPRTLGDINETASKSLNEIPLPLEEKYLGGEGPWLVNNIELQSLAYNITGDESNVLTIIKNFVAWIAANIQYEAHETPQYPDETLKLGNGDCDDQAILLITLSRIVGIPAFLQVGALYRLSPQLNVSYWENHVNVVQKNIGWHGWAIVYIPPWGWLPVDLTYVFGGLRGDPLNAIRNAAVTRQSTIQYMNISRTDQVASSQESREFLQTNNFYVYVEDEMIDVTPPRNPLGESGEQLIPLILIIAVALLLASSYFVANRFRRKGEKENNSSLDKC